GDFIEIPGNTIHQFRANKGDYIGFLCLVNKERDKVKLLSQEQMEKLQNNPKIKAFLESC
ncbi:MAG: cupin domain-containing protein, partial [Veillonella caviae]|nr:cupin domain-containing protein [Veillonella caviae]